MSNVKKLDKEYSEQSAILKAKEAILEIESRKADTNIVEGKKVFKKAAKKIEADTMPKNVRNDVDTLLKAEAKVDSSYKQKINVDSLLLAEKTAELKLCNIYADSLHAELINEIDLNAGLVVENMNLKAKVKRKNVRILEFLAISFAMGTLAILK